FAPFTPFALLAPFPAPLAVSHHPDSI
ncbi:MAG: hypothetical protein K0Q71_4830, partial [Thermomicrobiales bacterium]|nr:hypothetical protein [Thermomicrobiales bacterium]